MKYITKAPFLFFIAIALFQLSCDDRTPEENASTSDYTITMTAQPISQSGENVGEDIVGDIVNTRVSATLKDNNNNAVSDALIAFSSKKSNSSYGQMQPESGYTDENGIVTVIFKDPGDSPALGESKANLKSIYSQNPEVFSQTMVNVYPDTVVWPYSIGISSGASQIFKDISPLSSTVTVHVYNKLNNPVQSVYVDLSTDIGSFGDANQKQYTVQTDELGRATVTFKNNDDLGLATIHASYSHDALNSSLSDSVQVLIGTNYSISLSQYPVSEDSLGSWVIVGEDVSGDIAYTRLVATIVDASGNPVQDEVIVFTSESQGNAVGTVSYSSNISNAQGQVYANFDDNENVFYDLGETEDFEGVTITAFIGSTSGTGDSKQFSVYPTSVWPYTLSLNSDFDEITLDNGATFATLNGRLLNGLSKPVHNVTLSFSSDRGYLESQVTTDINGDYTLVFRDLGEQSDLGQSTITGSFSHPGFGGNI